MNVDLVKFSLLSNAYTITALKGDNEAKQAYYQSLEQSHTTGNREAFNWLVADAVQKSLNQYLGIIGG